MIIALFALAAAMIVGGLLAAILGWDIVLIERGWTMVIAGSIFAASGALLLGIAAAVARLSKMHEELSRLHADLNEDEPAAVSTASDFSRAALAGAGGLLGGAAVASSEPPPERDPDQPPLPLFPEAGEPFLDREIGAVRHDEAPDEPAVTPAVYPSSAHDPEEAPEVRVPDFLIAGRRETIYAEPGEAGTDDETLYEPEPEPQPAAEEAGGAAAEEVRDEPVEPEAAREEEAGSEPEAGEPAEEKGPEPAASEAEEERSAATIIGTYNSGDNRYVMYSDGSIEAETPQGVFRFGSLDELKEFIAAGGESSSST